MTSSRKLAIHSIGSEMGLNDAKVRQALHQRGMLTVGIPKTVEPIDPPPDAETIAAILAESG